MRRLFRQFSAPGGIPSHVSVTTPGSIHEGGELGYVLVHAFGAVMDNPDLLALAVVGDGEAETGPLEGSWKGISFLNPARDGAVLPVLHLNGAKIAGPTVLGRKDPAEVRSLLEGHGYDVLEVEGDDLPGMHHRFAAALAQAWARIRAIQAVGPRRRLGRHPAALADDRAAHPQGLDRPGRRRRRRRSPAPGGRTRCRCPASRRTRSTCALLEDVAAVLPPRGALRRRRRARPSSCAGANPDGRPADERHPARQRRPAHARPRPARLPRLRASTCRRPATVRARVDPPARRADARHLPRATPTASGCSAPTRPTATGSAPSSRSPTGPSPSGSPTTTCAISRDGRVMEVLSRAQLPRLAGGLHPHRPARACSRPTRRSRW